MDRMTERPKCYICESTSDLFVFHEHFVCGDCRYELRHGKPPAHEPTPGWNCRFDISNKEGVYNGTAYTMESE